ncbi:sigma 54-interacting transcriptional regulator [Limnoglobus roseus]|uniref:PAS domain-containing protein n=1 Tax=Limnoglobus roseus TaxID=2598579 RepID=A0A5C1ACU8_9BACT|nr:sigma 54-interacting transcriptional regulator [Limnoglobus roseus]QEL15977.1 PAS domain-containing protein [Limnoglobus roseus]
MSSPPPPPDDSPPRRERWSSLLQNSAKPLFVLYRTRRVRFVNAAWEQLTRTSAADAIGRACVRSGKIEPLFRTLAPPPEAIAGQVARVRRAVPPAKGGPPWWDVTFLPLTSADGAHGFLGVIDLVQPQPAVPAKKLPAVVADVREKHAAAFTFDLFASAAPTGERLLGQLRLAAQTGVPVWIVGEPGAGKETAARVIHHHSAHRERAFVACDGRGLQPYLIDSILFGHGGLAGSGKVGTLLLKSPAALPRDLQQRLADWLRAGPHPPRLICTSAHDAATDVKAGTLRGEFQTEFSVLELRVPPLRDRADDLPRILAALPATVSPEALAVLQVHAWPGNVRELIATVTDAADRAGGEAVGVAHLPRYLRERAMLAANPAPPAQKKWNLDDLLTAVEKRLIELALRKADGNQTEAAALLGIFRTRLGRRIEALKIADPGA